MANLFSENEAGIFSNAFNIVTEFEKPCLIPPYHVSFTQGPDEILKQGFVEEVG